MRAALWLIGLFAAAVALALFAGGNEGTVTVFWPPYRVDLSVNLVLLLLAALFALLYTTLRALGALLELPRQARRWRAQQRERATQALMLDARIQLAAGRYVRARKAAEGVLAREPGTSAALQTQRVRVNTLAHLTVAESAHALQDEATRTQHLDAALAAASSPGAAAELREAVLLRATQWALHRQEPAVALAYLGELPTGARRRTAALRLKLKAARLSGQLDDAMETARLLAKHRAFSPAAAQSLVRSLAGEQMARASDAARLRQDWNALDAGARAMPELALRAAQRLLELDGDRVLARQWLTPAWDEWLVQPEAWLDSQRTRLVRVLESALEPTGDPSDAQWLARIEAAQQAHPRDAHLQYLAGVACVHRSLWGRAQLLLSQAAGALPDAELRRKTWRGLAQLAELRGDQAAAAQAWRQAAQG